MLDSRERRDETKMRSMRSRSFRRTAVAIKALNLCNDAADRGQRGKVAGAVAEV
jgi:hypothetical protein